MLNVTDAFKTAVAKPRRRILGKVTISFSNPFLDASVEMSANEYAYISHPLQACDEIEDVNHKWASCDGSLKADGTFYACPDTAESLKSNQMGWWGSSMSDENGNFAEPYPTLTIEFSFRRIENVLVVGDSTRGEWPVDFDLVFYNADNELIFTDSITGNQSVSWLKSDYALRIITRIDLVIKKWSHSSRQAKIAEFFPVLMKTYSGDDLLLIDLLEEREFSTGSLPIGNISANELTVRINNADRRFDPGNSDSELYGLVELNRKVRAWLGVELPDLSIEWVPLGTFFSGEWSASESDISAETTAVDRMDLLTRDTFNGPVYENISLYQLAVNVLNDKGYKYWVDPELKNYIVPKAYFDNLTHRECIRLIAEASISQAYVSRDDEIRIEGPSYLESQSSVKQDITKSNYITKDNPANYKELANYITINTQPLVPGEVDEVYKTDDDTPESIGADQTITINVEYTGKPVVDALATLVNATTAEITDVKYYAWGADITIYSISADTFTITVTGKVLEVAGTQKITAQDITSIKHYGKMPYEFADNPLIQTVEMAKAVAEKCLSLSKDARHDLTMEWQGNPALTLGDLIRTPDTKIRPQFYLISQNISWDGGLTCTLKGKKAVSKGLIWNDLDDQRWTWNDLNGKKLIWDQLEVY